MYLDSTVQVFVLENGSRDKPSDLFFHCFYKAINFLERNQQDFISYVMESDTNLLLLGYY